MRGGHERKGTDITENHTFMYNLFECYNRIVGDRVAEVLVYDLDHVIIFPLSSLLF